MTASAAGAVNTAISPQQASLVLEVSRMLAVTTDLDTLLTHIAQAACGLLDCERASIFLHDEESDELCSRVALQASEICVPATAGIVGAAFTANETLHVANPYDDPRFNRDIDRKTGFVTRNLLTAPMVNLDRKPLGVVQAINKRGGPFAASDFALVQLLADQAGVALQRYQLQQTAMQAQAMRHEMNLARRVQEAMLPKAMPQMPGAEAAGWTRTASLTGGDCFDLWRTNDGRLAILLADASGHGLAPALVVLQVRTLIRAFAEIDPDPRRLLERTNARLCADLDPDRFCTAFLAFLAADGTLEWCSAGHGPILCRPSAGAHMQELSPGELPLGVLSELTGDPSPPVRFKAGGLLAVISDGIFEAPNPSGEQFGIDRVIRLIENARAAPAAQIIAALREAVTAWAGSDEPSDDQTIVVVRRV